MKTLKILILLLITNLISAQSSEKEVIDSMIKNYNSKDYTAFYNLISPSFKTQMSEKDLTGFLNNQVYNYYGNIKSIDLKSENQNQKVYTTQFEKGILDLTLVLNKQFQIDGFSFTPPKAEVIIKTDILSDNKLTTKLDSIVDIVVKPFIQNSANTGLSIGIVQNNETTFYHYGETKKETANLPNNNTIYEIGSISKTFTGYLLAEAINSKKINLDDDIRKYMVAKYPNLEFEGKPILIKHLVNHTATLPRLPENLDQQPNFDPENPYANYSKEMISKYLQEHKMKSQPGITPEYSNLGMALLAIILENKYRKTYNALLKTYITLPFKMKNTFENVPKQQKVNFATGYSASGLEAKHWDLVNFVGAGGIKSTIQDMTFYLKENMLGINPNIVLSHELTFESEKRSTGFAWVVNKNKDNNTFIWHNGGTGGFTSFCGFIKEKQTGIIILNNSGNTVDNLAISILKKL